MKKLTPIVALCMSLLLSSTYMAGEESVHASSKEIKAETAASVREPFSRMSPTELTSTGIQKLSLNEQEALVAWWGQHKNSSHQHTISKEVSISSIGADTKSMIVSDGSKISFNKSMWKKVVRWAVGDKIGFGDSGKRGSVTIYHMASGQKVKAKREQAPKQSSSPDQKK